MKKTSLKRCLLTVLLSVLLFGLSGCFVKPDKIVDETATSSAQVLPFETETPTPTLSPTQNSLVDWQNQTPLPVIVGEPTPTATILLYTASPAPLPTVTSPLAPTATASPSAAVSSKPVATSDGTLRVGSSGAGVRQIQQRLKELGYYSGSIDGDFGVGTQSAVREFQSANGLSVDGVVGSRTLSALTSSNAKAKPRATATPTPKPKKTATPTDRPPPKSYTPSTLSTYRYLQLGGGGSDVSKLQQRLKELGYYSGGVTGTFGESTHAAVEAFQRRNGLWVDGVAGEDTQRLLYSDSALPAK